MFVEHFPKRSQLSLRIYLMNTFERLACSLHTTSMFTIHFQLPTLLYVYSKSLSLDSKPRFGFESYSKYYTSTLYLLLNEKYNNRNISFLIS